jgi:hypothetical protein
MSLSLRSVRPTKKVLPSNTLTWFAIWCDTKLKLFPALFFGSQDRLQTRSSSSRERRAAGAYGYTRLGEWLFGGVTRDLLANSAVCCLMSH